MRKNLTAKNAKSSQSSQTKKPTFSDWLFLFCSLSLEEGRDEAFIS